MEKTKQILNDVLERILDHLYPILVFASVAAISLCVFVYVSHLTGIRCGTVIKKEFVPAHYYTTYDKIENCYKIGKNTTCSSVSVPRQVFVPDSYTVTIQGYEYNVKKQNWWSVDAETFHSIEVGQCFSVDYDGKCDR